MLVEDGYVRATAPSGDEWTFVPSFARVDLLGTPREIVQFYAELHGPGAVETARYVLATMCEQEDATPLIGWVDADRQVHAGLMPDGEMVIIARHLMQHGIIGRARPERGDGQYSEEFDVREYVTAAKVHLGLSSADAEAMSMSEFQASMAMKFPDEKAAKRRDVPSRAEYQAAMAAIKERARV